MPVSIFPGITWWGGGAGVSEQRSGIPENWNEPCQKMVKSKLTWLFNELGFDKSKQICYIEQMNDIKNFSLRGEKNGFLLLDIGLLERGFSIPHNLGWENTWAGGGETLVKWVVAVFIFWVCNLRYCSKCLLKFLPTLNSLSLIPTSFMEPVLTIPGTSDFWNQKTNAI